MEYLFGFVNSVHLYWTGIFGDLGLCLGQFWTLLKTPKNYKLLLRIKVFVFPEMGIDFYYAPASSPCRAVQLAAKAVGIELNLKPLDLMKGEHLKPEFLKVSWT